MLKAQKRKGLVLWMNKQYSSATRLNSFFVFLFLFLQCLNWEPVFTAAV